MCPTRRWPSRHRGMDILKFCWTNWWVFVERPRVALDVDEVLCRTAEAFCTWHSGQPADLTETGPTESRKQHFLLHTYTYFILFFHLQFSFSSASWFPNSSCFIPCQAASASIYFCFCRISKESFQRCYSTDSSALRDQFLSSDFSRMADPVSRGSNLLTTGQRYHTSTFTWKASGSWVIFDENLTGWVAKKHCSSWRRQVLRCKRLLVWWVFSKTWTTRLCLKFHVPLHEIHWLSSNVNPVFETSPFPRIQSTKFFRLWLHHTPMCNVPSFMRWLLGREAASQAQKAGRVSEKPRKSQSFCRVFLWSLRSLHFNFFNAMDVCLRWSTKRSHELNPSKTRSHIAAFVQDFWPDVTWLSWKFEPSLLPFAPPCLMECCCPWLWP